MSCYCSHDPVCAQAEERPGEAGAALIQSPSLCKALLSALPRTIPIFDFHRRPALQGRNSSSQFKDKETVAQKNQVHNSRLRNY